MGNMFTPESEEVIRTPQINIRKSRQFTEGEIKQLHEDFFQSHPTGKLKKEEFRKVYEKVFPNTVHTNMVDSIFRAFDRNNDGYIEFAEFLLSVSVTTIQGSPDEKLRLAFAIYDADGDGFISRDEVVDIISNIFFLKGKYESKEEAREHSQYYADKYMKKMDLNNDGKISLEEFLLQSKSERGIGEMLSQRDE